MGDLELVPIYLSDRRELTGRLGGRLERRFGNRCRSRTPWFDPEVAFDRSRGQYDSTRLLEQLLSDPARSAGRILGVAGVDLFIPVLTYVFGEAQLDGRAAVVSIHRLRPEVYGLPADDLLLLERLEKEAVHELGHTHGLVHCRDAACVMRVSTYVEDIDLKTSAFCPECLQRLESASPTRPPTGG